MNVAFLGLGLMGKPMALHLQAKGHTVRVYNRSAGKTAGCKEAGVTVCATPAEAATGCAIVFSCLGDGPDVASVLNEAAKGAAPGTLFVDHSTISPKAAQELEASLKSRGFRFLDAPVTGGQRGATEGQLSIMIGGSEADYNYAVPVIMSYAKKTTYIGPSGMGQVSKACNQILCVTTILGMAEAFALAEALGADKAKVFEAVKGGAGGSWSLENYGPKALKGDDSAGFFIKHQQKDLRIVLESARAENLPLPGTALIHELYKIVQARGGNECGNHALVRAYEIMSGGEWKAPEKK